MCTKCLHINNVLLWEVFATASYYWHLIRCVFFNSASIFIEHGKVIGWRYFTISLFASFQFRSLTFSIERESERAREAKKRINEFRRRGEMMQANDRSIFCLLLKTFNIKEAPMFCVFHCNNYLMHWRAAKIYSVTNYYVWVCVRA